MTIDRLSKKADIDRVMRKGRNVMDGYCGMRFLKTERDLIRATFVIGTKVDKRAVVRNRLRRQYREIVKALLMDTTQGYDILFFPTKKAISISHEERTEQLRQVLEKQHFITKASDSLVD